MADDLKNYERWFEKAEEDKIAAGTMLREKISPSNICFHSQQMVEKYLKGLLVYYKKKFRKVHDLLELEKNLLSVAPDIKEYEKDLDLLSQYYIETRYPGEYPEFTLDEAKQAFEAAKRIKKFVLEKMN